jgi:ferredoxin
MPQVIAQGQSIECPEGANLRQVLLGHHIPVHNGNAALINCRGIGTCGTCAVEIEGAVSAKSWREKARLSLPPHHAETSRRLACQVKVLGDIQVSKFSGFWGQGEERQW